MTSTASRIDPLNLTDDQRQKIAWEFAMMLARAELALPRKRERQDAFWIEYYEKQIAEARAIIDAMVSGERREANLRGAREVIAEIEERERRLTHTTTNPRSSNVSLD